MALRIIGEHKFPGTMLVAAMLRAHAATKGALTEKQATGIGMLDQYLRANGARNKAWGKATALTPGVAVARASLNKQALEAAGRALEAATEVEQRRSLLGDVIAPFFSSQITLFGAPVGESGNKPEIIEAGTLAEILKPELPEQELVIVANPPYGVISREQVTNAQYGIFIDQTGHRVPYYWADSDLGRQQPAKSVVGVNYSDDVRCFADWQGRSALTEPAFLSAKEANTLTANKPWEWTSTNEAGWQIIRSRRDSSRDHFNAVDRFSSHVAFRVAGTLMQ
ncbi:MAG: hypothetical protein JW873_04585 [Candidatus Saganbacteria bacterium]|nr:hypothetical protein [Candidatus Saganbacteria bacterium]